MYSVDPTAIILIATGTFLFLTLVLVILSNRRPKNKTFKSTPITTTTSSYIYTGDSVLGGFVVPPLLFGVTLEQAQGLMLVEELDDPREDDGTEILILEGLLEGGCEVPYASDEAKSLIERHDNSLKEVSQLRLILDRKDKLIGILKEALRDKRAKTFVDNQKGIGVSHTGGALSIGGQFTNNFDYIWNWPNNVFGFTCSEGVTVTQTNNNGTEVEFTCWPQVEGKLTIEDVTGFSGDGSYDPEEDKEDPEDDTDAATTAA